MTESSSNASSSTESTDNRSKLGIAIGSQHWLIDLSEAGEILPIPDSVTPVPATKSWFQGVANLRGALYGVTDLLMFQGHDSISTGKETRLLAFSEALGVNAAILVGRIMGLQNMDNMKPEGEEAEAEAVEVDTWAGTAWVDQAGICWRDLSLAKLARDEEFLSVNR